MSTSPRPSTGRRKPASSTPCWMRWRRTCGPKAGLPDPAPSSRPAAQGSRQVSGPRPEKVALIVGGSRGIGAAISRRLAADGCAVAIVHLSRSEEAARLAAELEAGGARVLVAAADIADPAALLTAIDLVLERFGRIDILVNNAGLAVNGPLGGYRLEDFDRVFAVNV